MMTLKANRTPGAVRRRSTTLSCAIPPGVPIKTSGPVPDFLIGSGRNQTALISWDSNRRSDVEPMSETASRARKQKAKLFDLWVEIPPGVPY